MHSINIRSFILFLSLLLSSSAFAATGLSATTILIGQSAPFSGPAKDLGEETRSGIELCFEAINARGGINGRKLKLVSADDGYEPALARRNTVRLVDHDGVLALLGYVGTDTSLAAMPVFSYHEVPFVGPVTGSDLLRVPHNRYVFNIRASFTDEASRIVDQLLATGIRRIAVFYQNDAQGLDGLEAVRTALEKQGLQLVAKGSVKSTGTDVSSAVYLINRSTPDAVVMFTGYKQAAAFIREMRQQGSNTQFYNTSLVGSRALVAEPGAKSHGVVVSQVMPHPWSGTSPLVREYKKLIAEAGRAPSYGSLEGFVAARVLVEGLRRAGTNPSRESLVAALEGMRNVDLDGFGLTFTPTDHNGGSLVDLTIVGRDGRFLR